MDVDPVIHHVPLTTPRDYTRAIIREVTAQYGSSLHEVLGPSRAGNVVKARYAAIRAVAQARPRMSTPELGRIFRRDYSTILHALGRLSRRPSPHAMAAE